MSNQRREIHLKRTTAGNFVVSKLINVPPAVEVGENIISIEAPMDESFVQYLFVELPKMQIDLVVEM